MPRSVKTSVIIPTYNGAQKVLDALESLLLQSMPPDEVILVIDGSTDNTAAIVAKSKFPLPNFKIIEQANGGRANVRNRGAQEASGELLVFLDDDMVVPKGWLAAHVHHHQLHPGSILTGKLEDPNATGENDFLRFKAWLNQRWNKDLVSKSEHVSAIDYAYLSANNCSLSKMVFDIIGGFDERLTDAEDYDLAVRAKMIGIQLFTGNAAFAWHNDRTDCKRYIKRLREYQKAQEKLLLLKPDLYQEHRYAVVKPKGMKKIIFRFFALGLWPVAIDRGWLMFLPESIRYRIYDFTVTAKGVYNF